MEADIRKAIRVRADAGGCGLEVKPILARVPVRFNETLVGHVRRATQRLGYSSQELPSGAGHDALYFSTRSTMIFVPCFKGISHNPLENAKFDDVVAGANVLLQAVLAATEDGGRQEL